MNRFTDKVFIITGGGGGIGLASARLLAEKGAKVLITGRREEKLRAVEREVPGVAGLVIDATEPDAPERTVKEAIDRWSRVDGLVNNAGGGVVQPLEAATGMAISDLFKINVSAPDKKGDCPLLKVAHGYLINES